jgi:hypothetical protein
MKVGLEKQGALHAKMHVNQQKKDANLEWNLAKKIRRT